MASLCKAPVNGYTRHLIIVTDLAVFANKKLNFRFTE